MHFNIKGAFKAMAIVLPTMALAVPFPQNSDQRQAAASQIRSADSAWSRNPVVQSYVALAKTNSALASAVASWAGSFDQQSTLAPDYLSNLPTEALPFIRGIFDIEQSIYYANGFPNDPDYPFPTITMPNTQVLTVEVTITASRVQPRNSDFAKATQFLMSATKDVERRATPWLVAHTSKAEAIVARVTQAPELGTALES